MKLDSHEKQLIPYWVEGFIDSPIGKIKKIKTILNRKDKLDNIKVRFGINRYNYKVDSGLYAVGNPNQESNVLVTANYKLTFDGLRKELKGQDLWILVLDTKGINVWCAAGKGTFGTEELINRIELVCLEKLISHKNIILPQLGAVGVEAYKVTKVTGFKVNYGPVRAEDIKAYIKNNFNATEEMREVKFDLKDRTILTPLEFVNNFKYYLLALVLFIILNIISGEVVTFNEIAKHTIFNSLPYLGSLVIGTIIIPILLPYIPFRAFALKGLFVGLIWSGIAIIFGNFFLYPDSILFSIANLLIITTMISALSLNFTGSTTYTSLSGVEKETKKALPIYIGAIVIGVSLIVAYLVL